MEVYTFKCHSTDGVWGGKQYNGDLEASAESTYDLQRKLVKKVQTHDSSREIRSSFSLITPSSAVFQVIVGGSYITQEIKPNIKKITTAESMKINSCLKLFENIWLNESKDENFAFSPFSIFAALGILASGSSGETLKQILKFLNYENLDDLNRVITYVIEELIQTDNGEGPKLSFVSGIWSTDKYALNPVFKKTVSASYKAEVESVDFELSEAVRWKVNNWVETKTNGLIQDILPQGSIDSSTVVVAANALYFKGSWQPNQFNPDLTREKPFYLLSGRKIKVPFMFTEEYYLCVSCYKDFKVLKLPYSYRTLEVAAGKKNGNKFNPSSTQRFSMYIVLPNTRDGLGEVIGKVSSDTSGFLGSYLPTSYVAVDNFMLPKFKITFDFQAPRVLKELGLELPFDEGKAEFSEMLMGNKESICVSDVIHKCHVEVDEEGTEAAAATVEMSFSLCDDDDGGYCRPRGIDFVADHPFMYMIREENSGVVLFMGHVLNPLLDS